MMILFRNLINILLIVVLFVACKNDTNPTKETITTEKVTAEKKTSPANTEKTPIKIDRIYNFKEVDSPALFSANCKSAENPNQCSQAKMKEYISSNIILPESAKKEEIKRREVISFTVLPDGSLDENIRSISQQEVCLGCRSAAMKVISNMDNWVPAQKDGRPVAMSVVVPVAFR